MKDLTNGIHFEIFSTFHSNTDRKPKWYWRLVARNGKIVADGAEHYASKSNVIRAINMLKRRCLFIESFRIVNLDGE